MKFQVGGEELITFPAYAVQCEAILEKAKGLWDNVFGGKRLLRNAAAVDACGHDSRQS
jgi:hypothetical protein